jgi:hypothetical protein
MIKEKAKRVTRIFALIGFPQSKWAPLQGAVYLVFSAEMFV